MLAVILAGGYGTRLSEETTKKPKPLVEIGHRPIIWHIMKNLNFQGFSRFIILAGYKAYSIKEYFLNYYAHQSDLQIDMKQNKITYLKSYSEDWVIEVIDTGLDTMTGGRLLHVHDSLPDNEPFLFTYGDGLADINITDLLTHHKNSGKLATVTAVYPPARFGALSINQNDEVVSFSEKPVEESGRINGGFFILQKEVIKYIQNSATIWENEPLSDLVNARELNAYPHNGFWQPMDTLREKIILENLWETGKAPWRNW